MAVTGTITIFPSVNSETVSFSVNSEFSFVTTESELAFTSIFTREDQKATTITSTKTVTVQVPTEIISASMDTIKDVKNSIDSLGYYTTPTAVDTSTANPISPQKSGPNLPLILGSTIGSTLFVMLVLIIVTEEHVFPSNHKAKHGNQAENVDLESSLVSRMMEVTLAPPASRRIRRHQDSGWRPALALSEETGSSILDVPPEYEHAV
ncbi:hypothetical protein VNI00_015138 [Paramarasmius palmivorus]|uniref:Uncharacterized protein n=1 Tax=Paramarasmius palmivorus TaxID=297713 RepID=A0AAW0BNV3_9AGAR